MASRAGWMKFGQRMMGVVGELTANETRVYLQLGILSRKPYGGDPGRGIPPTPADEVGVVRAERGRRLTNTRLSELCGVPRRKVGAVLQELNNRGLIGRTAEGHLRVVNLAYLTGESDEPEHPDRLDEHEMGADSATEGGTDSAAKGGRSSGIVPQKVAPVAAKGGGRWTPESLDDSEMGGASSAPISESIDAEPGRVLRSLELAPNSPGSGDTTSAGPSGETVPGGGMLRAAPTAHFKGGAAPT